MDLAVTHGEIFGIIGRSGAGKSTLVRLLNGLERADSGTVIVDGVDMADVSGSALRTLRRRVQMIFQNFGLLSSRTVAQNVALPLRIAGADLAGIDGRVADLLHRVGLIDYAGKYPSQLSGGQKQRVGIARALATAPDILLCDEATSALDPETTASILALIADLNRELGLTIIVITHEMDVVRQLCDRVAVLHNGRVVESGLVSDIFFTPAAQETRALLTDAGADGAMGIAFPGRVVHLALEGEALAEPVLTRIARATGVDFTILASRIGHFRAGSVGQFTLGLSGGDQDAALAALADQGRVRE
ncbi:methionine ABC transporter ATP-binding protein [Sandaracinobacter sp. RS1-74]|uniref:methionine ABC transporter ATP-binding protein n=1 Tax=Sandaracinobacteroides sayramensis TaxID=2913411 RepID=UPI001ED9D556|nr:methionine ABC transporter ATP-binding protein [Sandaracinobacteroides sayramensis]